MNDDENEETFLADFDLLLRDIVQIPEEMLISQMKSLEKKFS